MRSLKMLLLLTGKIHNHHASRPLAQKHHIIMLWPNVFFERIHLFKIAILSMLCLSSSLSISLLIEKKMLNLKYSLVLIFVYNDWPIALFFVHLYSMNMFLINLFYLFWKFEMIQLTTIYLTNHPNQDTYMFALVSYSQAICLILA